ARRTIVADRKRAPRRHLSVHSAHPPGRVVMRALRRPLATHAGRPQRAKQRLSYLASTLALDADLFDFDCRVVDGRLDSFDALLGDDTDDENRDDLKGRVPGPCRREIAPAQIG